MSVVINDLLPFGAERVPQIFLLDNEGDGDAESRR